tara:strand:- start:4163 stop:4579 length:417 start_codon:yes stop_codon:yes gene_type:complete
MRYKNKKYIFDSLIITIIALDNFTPYLDQDLNGLEKHINSSNFRTSNSLLVTSEIYFFNPTIKRKITLLLNSINKRSFKRLKKNNFERQKIKQYLRRFSFLYQSFILKNYPNDFSDIATHKINIRAIKNLYILSNLGT